MPEQKPTWRIISTSYSVRMRSRWASSILPWSAELGQPLLQLTSICRTARSIRSLPAT